VGEFALGVSLGFPVRKALIAPMQPAAISPVERLASRRLETRGCRGRRFLDRGRRGHWGRFVKVRRLGREILGLDESFAKPPRRRLGTIPSAPYRLVGTFPFPSTFPFAWNLTPSLSGPFWGTWRRRLARCVSGFDRGRAAAIIAATASPTAGLALLLATPVSRPWLQLKLLAGMALKILRLHIRHMEEPVASD
jgi:hypothetical protein